MVCLLYGVAAALVLAGAGCSATGRSATAQHGALPLARSVQPPKRPVTPSPPDDFLPEGAAFRVIRAAESTPRYVIIDGDNGGGPRTNGGSFIQYGVASWYGPKFHGRRTANGERYDQHQMTAAHPELPFGSQVRVTNLQNRRSAVVRINDRGPYRKNRVVDLSRAAAQHLDMEQDGLAWVRVDLLDE